MTTHLAPGRLLATRRAKLVGVLLMATVAVSVLAVSAAGSSLSYYVTPEEFAQKLDPAGTHWRVGGRVVDGTIAEDHGRPVAFSIVGDKGERMAISYDGVTPDLFGPGAFVVIEGTADGPSHLHATSVLIKHESAFYAATPTPTVPPSVQRTEVEQP